MAKAKTKKRKATVLPTLEEQLAAHDLDAPEPGPSDAYGASYKRQWMRRRAELVAAIGRRDAKRRDEERTVEVVAPDPDDAKKKRNNITRCMQSEAFRYRRLTSMQQSAQSEMEFAYRLVMSHGPGAAVAQYGLQRGGSNRADTGSAAEASWREWCVKAIERRIMVPAFIDCLAEPKTLEQVERDHRMRRGMAFDNYARGLDLWCELRKWIRGPSGDGGPHLEPEGVAR